MGEGKRGKVDSVILIDCQSAKSLYRYELSFTKKKNTVGQIKLTTPLKKKLFHYAIEFLPYS